MNTAMTHKSVLLQEVIESLNLHKGGTYVDGTFGAGGHSRQIARAISHEGHLISFDQDETVFNEAIVRAISEDTRFTHVVENFGNAKAALVKLDIQHIDGAMFDLGLSSTQLEESGRGFSFQRDEPLWMTFKHSPKEEDVTAIDIVNHWSEESIATILKGFGDERFARSIARGIVEARSTGEIRTTSELVEIIRTNTPGWYQHGRTHFATRTFQALRMAVNDELGVIEKGIRGVFELLSPGGRISVISFHSIEDRLVKQLFRDMNNEGLVEMITKKPIVPSDEELKENPRARSAKLRVIQKL